MANDYQISAYDSMSDITMCISNCDTLSITFHDDCEWCFEDPDNCFGGRLPAKGHHRRGDGLFSNIHAINPGNVKYNAVVSGGECKTDSPVATVGHTITVNS